MTHEESGIFFAFWQPGKDRKKSRHITRKALPVERYAGHPPESGTYLLFLCSSFVFFISCISSSSSLFLINGLFISANHSCGWCAFLFHHLPEAIRTANTTSLQQQRHHGDVLTVWKESCEVLHFWFNTVPLLD